MIMKPFLFLLFWLAVASCGRPSGNGLKNKLQTAAATYCSDPSYANQLKLQSYLETYESLGNKLEHVTAFAQGVLDGSVNCQNNQQKKAVTSDGVTLSCPSAPVDVEYGPVTIDCSFTFEVDEGIFSYYIYAYVDSVNGYYYYEYPSGNDYSDPTASQTIINGNIDFTLPQYAPSGTWTVYAYAYSLGDAIYVYNTATFVVEATVNDNGPPVCSSLYFPTVDLKSSASLYVPFTCSDDLSGVKEFYVSFYDNTSTYLLGDAYWGSDSSEPILSISTFASGTLYGVPLGTYYANLELYDEVGFHIQYDPTELESAGLPGTIANAASNCTAGKYLPIGATGPCLTCPVGTYSLNEFIACTPCPAGYKGDGKGAGACIACSPGSYSIGGAAGCSLCTAGKFSSESGTAVCTPCAAGSFSSSPGATSCTLCGPGTHSCGGTTSCSLCIAGTYNPSYESSYCTQCPSGTYTSVSGSTSCTPCPVGTYAAKVGSTSCTSCPSGQYSPAGSVSALSCSS